MLALKILHNLQIKIHQNLLLILLLKFLLFITLTTLPVNISQTELIQYIKLINAHRPPIITPCTRETQKTPHQENKSLGSTHSTDSFV